MNAYIRRIGVVPPLPPSIDTLRRIQRAHLETVPFENLDLLLGRPIPIDVDLFYRKVVRERRGGFCYELNGLFCELLRSLGFRVTLHSARVWNGSEWGPEFDHLCLRVDLDESWLVDVGFGDSFLLPLRFAERGEQFDAWSAYRLLEDGADLILEERKPNAAWTPSYRVAPVARRLEEFAEQCHWFQHDPTSNFLRKTICSRATPEGRITLSGMRRIETRDGVKSESLLSGAHSLGDALRTDFGIRLSEPQLERLTANVSEPPAA